jgi:hypothetical protein
MSGTQNTGNENTEVAKPKTVSLLRFKTDRTKEVEGVWVDVGGGLRFKVARMGNPQYEQYLMKRGRFFGRRKPPLGLARCTQPGVPRGETTRNIVNVGNDRGGDAMSSRRSRSQVRGSCHHSSRSTHGTPGSGCRV